MSWTTRLFFVMCLFNTIKAVKTRDDWFYLFMACLWLALALGSFAA